MLDVRREVQKKNKLRLNLGRFVESSREECLPTFEEGLKVWDCEVSPNCRANQVQGALR